MIQNLLRKFRMLHKSFSLFKNEVSQEYCGKYFFLIENIKIRENEGGTIIKDSHKTKQITKLT